MIAFWREIFDAKISDYIEDRISGVDLHFTFLRVNPRHHSIAVAATKGLAMDPFATKIQHLEMQAATLDDIGAAYRRCRALGFKIAMAVGQHPNDRDVSFYAVTPSGFYFELGWSSEGDERSRGLAADDPPRHQRLGPQTSRPDARRQARANPQRRDLAVAHRILAFLNKNSLSEGNALWTRLRTSMTSQSSGSARPG